MKETNRANLQKQWYEEGEKYAQSINEMVAFAEENGWDKWKGKEPQEKRERLAEGVFDLLKEANLENRVDEFRKDFPPSHAPMVRFMDNKSQSITQLYFIEEEKIVFLTGASYETRQAYLLDGNQVTELDDSIRAVGKSKQGNIFAVVRQDKVAVYKGWEGPLLNEFTLYKLAEEGITELIPFNDGSKVLVVSSEGIYLLDQEEKLIHPDIDWNELEEEEDPDHYLDMENGTMDHKNQYIVVADQCSEHRILNLDGEELGSIGPQSSYPHFCLFSKDDSQLITNSCHFYNGITIGVDRDKLDGAIIEPYEESDDYVVIDEEMRIYAGVATSDYYILGDAYGYIKAFDKSGKKIWRHFLGSTISGMTLSDDEKTLWVGSYSGMLHKLQLGKGHRDTHTIGNGDHYEVFRLLLWKDEPQVWVW
ncbi:MAG: hypothetical protein LUH22_14415 [Bacteroides sp.]|nr:hypothetical protein [Bacteroides sp.]